MGRRYMVFGHMFEMVTQADLTAARQEQLNRVEWPAARIDQWLEVKS
jgi:hypothetical protein